MKALTARNVIECLEKTLDSRIWCKAWEKGNFERVYCSTKNSKGRKYQFHVQAKPDFKIEFGTAAYFRDQRGVTRNSINRDLTRCGIMIPVGQR
jgi:hypothetical protein